MSYTDTLDDYIDLIIMTKFELSSIRNFSQRLRERLVAEGQKFLYLHFFTLY